jgi:hypothetical protein
MLAAVDVPLLQRGEAVVAAMLSAWANPDSARILRTSLLIAAHEPAAMARVRAVFSDGLIPAISEGIDPDKLSVRGGLVSSHVIGPSFAPFLFALDAAAAIPNRQLISRDGRTIHRYLTEPLTKPTAETTQDDTSSG